MFGCTFYSCSTFTVMETDVLLHVLHLSTYHLIQRGKGWGGSWDKRPVLGAVLSSLVNLLAGAAPGAGAGGWGFI